jgi:hypothetical protein
MTVQAENQTVTRASLTVNSWHIAVIAIPDVRVME